MLKNYKVYNNDPEMNLMEYKISQSFSNNPI